MPAFSLKAHRTICPRLQHRRRCRQLSIAHPPLLWTSGFDGHAQELRECSATLERAFAHVERADLGPGLLDDFAFLIDLLVAQGARWARSTIPTPNV
jgi:hypothetical protein